MGLPIYLDYNGTTPHHPEVIAALRPYLESDFGNPSSNHCYGQQPRQAVKIAREQVAALLNCHPSEIVFTSGGTESNNHAIAGIARSMREKGRHIVTSAFEHPAVLAVCHQLKSEGFTTTFVPVDEMGRVDAERVEQAIRTDTILITIMHSNNEVGTIQPISDIAQIANDRGINMHTDAAQSIGKVSVDVQSLGVDLLSVAGHKLYAPKGVGALYVRKGVTLQKFCHGAGQEMGWRAGTENVPSIVALGKACQIARRDHDDVFVHLKTMRDRLHRGIQKQVKPLRLNGHPEQRLPNTVSLAFKGVQANHLLDAIGHQVAASPGAACHSEGDQISHVLAAMRVPDAWAKGTIRFSVGRMTTADEVDQAVAVIAQALTK